jgi:hypothetical protein
MGIEDDIRYIKDLVQQLWQEKIVASGQLIRLETKLDKLLKQQHEAVLWETKGKDNRVKGSLGLELEEQTTKHHMS